MAGPKPRDRFPTPDFANAAELRERVCRSLSRAPEVVRNLFLAANGVTTYTECVQDKQRNRKTERKVREQKRRKKERREKHKENSTAKRTAIHM